MCGAAREISKSIGKTTLAVHSASAASHSSPTTTKLADSRARADRPSLELVEYVPVRHERRHSRLSPANAARGVPLCVFCWVVKGGGGKHFPAAEEMLFGMDPCHFGGRGGAFWYEAPH